MNYSEFTKKKLHKDSDNHLYVISFMSYNDEKVFKKL